MKSQSMYKKRRDSGNGIAPFLYGKLNVNK